MKERAQPENGPADDRRKASPPGRARPGARAAAEPRAPQPVTPEPVADAPGWYVVRRPGPEPSADRKRFDDALFDQPLFDEPLLDQPLVDEPPPPEVPAGRPGWSIARVLGAAMVALALLAFGIALIDAYLLEPPSGDGATARPIAATQPPPASSPPSDPAGMEPHATAARPAGGERTAAAAAPADLARENVAPEDVAPEDVEPPATARDSAPEIAAEPPPQDGPGVPRAEAAISPATGPPETGREAAAALERLIAERRRGAPDGAQAAPGASDTRVFLHYAGADLANADLARRLAEHLRQQGLTVADIRTVDFPIEQPSVRFFFEGDQSAGQRLVETLAGFFDRAPSQVPERASDFTHHTPKPRPGGLEIWLRDS